MATRTRRQFIAGIGAALGATSLGHSVAAGQEEARDLGPNRLVLLGTRGGPLITGYAPTPSANLIVFNGIPLLIDAGYGVTLKLLDAHIPLQVLRYIFITHHHSDHNLELGPLLYNAWASGLGTSVDVYGPNGLNALLGYYWKSNGFDIETRISDEGRPDLRRLVRPHEFTEGRVMSFDSVKVSSLRNHHPPVVESYALKFELGLKTVVFSGDTTFFPPLADFAKGADYLVHEVTYGPALDAMFARRPNAARLRASILSHHTTAEDVGRIATLANVKALVLNHFVPGDDPSLTPKVWADAVRATFKGEIIVGRDMLTLAL
jgi:ribonuclease BN (tRNA processing enzyme)